MAKLSGQEDRGLPGKPGSGLAPPVPCSRARPPFTAAHTLLKSPLPRAFSYCGLSAHLPTAHGNSTRTALVERVRVQLRVPKLRVRDKLLLGWDLGQLACYVYQQYVAVCCGDVAVRRSAAVRGQGREPRTGRERPCDVSCRFLLHAMQLPCVHACTASARRSPMHHDGVAQRQMRRAFRMQGNRTRLDFLDAARAVAQEVGVLDTISEVGGRGVLLRRRLNLSSRSAMVCPCMCVEKGCGGVRCIVPHPPRHTQAWASPTSFALW